jgi:hypothetical protein
VLARPLWAPGRRLLGVVGPEFTDRYTLALRTAAALAALSRDCSATVPSWDGAEVTESEWGRRGTLRVAVR